MRDVVGAPGITYTHGDLLEASNFYIAHGCNAQGVMGSGVAKALRTKWPSIYPPYLAACDAAADPRNLLGTYTAQNVDGTVGGRRILNVITQLEYGREPGRRYVSYDAIDNGFRAVVSHMSHPRKGIAIPMVGAGLAQGNWGVIETILSKITIDLNTSFRVYIEDREKFLEVVNS